MMFTPENFSIGDSSSAFRGIGPQANEYHPLPLIHGIEHRGSCLLLYVPYAALGNAILEVCIDPTVQQALSLHFAIGNEGVVGELTIVGVIMQDFYSVLLHRTFESMFGHHRFFAREAFLEVYERIPGELIDKDRCILILLLSELAFELGDKAGGVGLQLVHRNYLPGLCSCFGSVFIVSLDLPRSLCHFAILEC